MFGKLFIWNMTQYSAVLWLDSDSIAVRSLHPLFAQADNIPGPGSAEAGPRIGATHNRPSYEMFLSKTQSQGGTGQVMRINLQSIYSQNSLGQVIIGNPYDYDYDLMINSGSFLIRPGIYTWSMPSNLSLIFKTFVYV